MIITDNKSKLFRLSIRSCLICQDRLKMNLSQEEDNNIELIPCGIPGPRDTIGLGADDSNSDVSGSGSGC